MRLTLNVNGDHAKIVNVLLKKMETVVLMMMNAIISYCKGLKTDGETITVGICTKLVENGGECTKDNDCAWGSICNLNKCVEKYSLADGVAADNKVACQGGKN